MSTKRYVTSVIGLVVFSLLLPGIGAAAIASSPDISAQSPVISFESSSQISVVKKSAVADLDLCRIQDQTFRSDVSIGFPRPKDALGMLRPVRVLAIPVEFADLSVSKRDQSRFKAMYRTANRFYKSQSYGVAGVEVTIVPSKSWIRLSETTKQLRVKSKTFSYEDRRGLLRSLMQQISSDLKADNFDQVDFLLPYWAETRFDHVEMDLGERTPAGLIDEAIIWGGSAAGSGAVYTHEIGHSWLRFEDLYLLDPRAAGYGNSVYGAAGVWDIMNSTFRENPEMFSWHRFLSGWLKDDQVTCLENVDRRSEYFLSPIAKADGRPKTVFYRLGEGKILAMEARRKIGFDNTNEQGVLVYLVNTNIAHAMGPIKTIRPIRSGGIGDEWVPGLIRKGEFIKTQGIVIRNIKSDRNGETIVIEPSK